MLAYSSILGRDKYKEGLKKVMPHLLYTHLKDY